MAENNLIVYKVQVDTASGKVAIDGLTKGFVNASTAVNKLKKEMDTLATSTQGVGTSSGIAGAFINEFGRTISDLPYGIQAISNNISQLGSLFAVMVVSSNGLNAAIKSLWTTLKASPVLIGLLAFQAITAAITYFDKQASKANKTLNEFNKSLSGVNGNIAQIEKYAKILKDSTSSIERQEYALRQLKKEGYDKLVGSLDDFLKAKKAILLFDIKEKFIKDEAQKLMEKEIELQGKLAEANEKREKRIQNILKKTSITQSQKSNDILYATREAAEATGEIKDEIDGVQKEIEKLINQSLSQTNKLIDELGGNPFFDSLTGGDKESQGKRKRLLKQNLLDFSNEIESFNRDSEVKAVEFEEDKLAREVKYAKLRIQNEYALFLEKEKIRYLDALGEAKGREEKTQIETTWNNTKKQAKEALGEALTALDSSTANKQEIIEQNKQARIRSIIMQSMSDEAAFKIQMATNDFDRIAGELDAQKIAHETRMALLEEEKQARIDAGYETSEIDARINNEKNDNAAKSAKIQRALELSKLDVINQVGQAAIEIAGEGSAIGKAVAVAMAIMNTREAITNALGAKPYGPWNIAQAVAVGAAGFAQVRGIMAQQLPVPSKGGGAGTPSVQAPDFNIVGANQTNQLASAIQGQFNSPIKAYVVAKDVSTAQELDRNVVNAASIG